MWYFESGNFLWPLQYAFRKVRSPTDILLSLESSTCETFASSHNQVTAFFSIWRKHTYTTWIGAMVFYMCFACLNLVYVAASQLLFNVGVFYGLE